MRAIRKINTRFWIPAIIAGILFSLFALAPQFALWVDRGANWNGSFAIGNYDEPAYAAYVQSLIDGKPLRNSPYTGATSATNPEYRQSLFSIQFLASLPTALFARTFGLRAATAMIFLAGISAFLSAFSIFWLLFLMTDHPFFALTATVSVLTLGSVDLEATNFLTSFFEGTELTRMHSAFMRRSVPAISFPAFILFHCFVWKFIDDEKERMLLLIPVVLSFAFLVYSYLFHWTAAAAWIFALVISIVVFKRDLLSRRTSALLILAAALTTITIPYAFLVADRATNIDSVQLFLNTRVPDLFEVSELIAALSAVLVFFARKRGLLPINRLNFVFLLSMIILPFLVFNQQLVTGITFQPFHYAVFAVNYTALIAFFSVGFYCGKEYLSESQANRLLFLVSSFILFFGLLGTAIELGNLRTINAMRDEFAGAAKAIGTLEKTRSAKSDRNGMVVSFDLHNFTYPNNDDLPTLVSKPVLWAPHQIVFSDLTTSESRNRFFALIHLSNYDENWIRANVEKNQVLRGALFGWGRYETRLTGDSNPIGNIELDRVCAQYSDFRKTFSYESALEMELDFLIAYDLAPNDFKIIDQWYKRDRTILYEDYSVFRVQLKDKENDN